MRVPCPGKDHGACIVQGHDGGSVVCPGYDLSGNGSEVIPADDSAHQAGGVNPDGEVADHVPGYGYPIGPAECRAQAYCGAGSG